MNGMIGLGIWNDSGYRGLNWTLLESHIEGLHNKKFPARLFWAGTINGVRVQVTHKVERDRPQKRLHVWCTCRRWIEAGHMHQHQGSKAHRNPSKRIRGHVCRRCPAGRQFRPCDSDHGIGTWECVDRFELECEDHYDGGQP